VFDVRQDLTPYRELSERIFELLRSYTPFVERLVSRIYRDPSPLCSRMARMDWFPDGYATSHHLEMIWRGRASTRRGMT
jgi:hypothetical protein